jgi:hypothetical protein
MKALATILSADASITALVSDRFYFHEREQAEVMPAITLRNTNNEPSHTKSGASNLDSVTTQIICFDDKYNDAKTLAELVRAALDRVASQTIGGEIIQQVDFLDEFSDFEQITNKKVHYIEQNYQVRIERS